MAEGGVDYHKETSFDTGDHSLDSRLLECPICLEQLRQPKSLPCLHCFCQECLHTFITKEPYGSMQTLFSCPVCRRVTQPIDPSEKRENWAKQFPTNSVIEELIQLQTKSHAPCYCKPCVKKGNMETPAQVWCKSLNMFFCESCKVSIHDFIHEGCDPKVITGTDVRVPRESPAVVKCNKHQNKVEYYCEDHRELGCSKCIIVDHRICKVVTTTEEYCGKLKISSQQNDLLESLQQCADTIEFLIKDFHEQLQTLGKGQDIGLKSITDFREQIINFLDKAEKELTDELITATKQEKENLQVTSLQCEHLKTSILNTLEASKSAAVRNDDVETILLYQRGQVEVEACKDLVTEMRKTYTSVNVKHVIDPRQTTIGKDTRFNLGKIVVEKQPRHLPGKIVVEKQPRHLPNSKGYPTALLECCAKEIGKFCIKSPSDGSDCLVKGVVYLPDNHIVVADYGNNKLKLYTDKGQYLNELKVNGSLRDMCMVDTNTVAVAVSLPGKVHVINVQSSKLSLLYSMDSPNGNSCYGITHTDGKFIVYAGEEIYRMTNDGNNNLLKISETYCLSSDSKHGYIYGSRCTYTTGEVAVYRLSGNNTKTDLMKVGVVKYALGLDVDKEGNVYICGKDSDNIVQMSGDGNNVRELLTSPDGIRQPTAIAIRDNRFVVSNRGDKRNYVHIFEFY